MSTPSDTSFERVNLINDTRRAMEDQLRKRSEVYDEMVERMRKVYGDEKKDDGLDQTNRILIALAMAVGSGTQSAVEWTMTRALNHGASEQMILDAIDVALTNRGTFAVANARFAYEALNVRTIDTRHS